MKGQQSRNVWIFKHFSAKNTKTDFNCNQLISATQFLSMFCSSIFISWLYIAFKQTVYFIQNISFHATYSFYHCNDNKCFLDVVAFKQEVNKEIFSEKSSGVSVRGGEGVCIQASVSQFWPQGDENKNVLYQFRFVLFISIHFLFQFRQPKIVYIYVNCRGRRGKFADQNTAGSFFLSHNTWS